MTDGLRPTETTDAQITVVVLSDATGVERLPCESFEEAIETVKEELAAEATVKIENREQDIVFTSESMQIADWESAWRSEKRRLSVHVEEHDCPYGVISCVFDDLCVQCKIDKARDGPR
ncbi:hypothetical protein [Haloarchaeobius sp. TZWWS8]|uniref:hypothetical protein n=1 Tax=Haloarchaeobius sp. TZWWS8 TaxID=3446121 RepID=UPI003EBAC031